MGALLASIRRQLLGVALEVPSHPGPNLRQASISAADQDAADLAPVTVGLATLGHGLTVSRQCCQVLLRCPSEWLPQLWGVDPIQPDLVLALLGVQQRDAVAVMDPHDTALDGMRAGLRTAHQTSQE